MEHGERIGTSYDNSETAKHFGYEDDTTMCFSAARLYPDVFFPVAYSTKSSLFFGPVLKQQPSDFFVSPVFCQ